MEGRTVLFVSHNMVAIQSLCKRGVWINNGKIVDVGQTGSVVSNYLQSSVTDISTNQVWNDIDTAPGNDVVRLHRVCARPEKRQFSDQITMQTPFIIEVEYWNLIPNTILHITLHVYTEQGIIAFTTGSASDSEWKGRDLPVGLLRSACCIPGNLLNSGVHRVNVLVVKDLSSVIYQREDAIAFEVVDVSERNGAWYGKEPGVLQPRLPWTTEYLKQVINV